MKFFRYLFVGITAFAVDFAVFRAVGCILAAGGGAVCAHSGAANTISMLTGFLYSFIMNRKWTFKSHNAPLKQFLLCGAVLFLNICISNMFIKYMTEKTDIDINAVKVGAQMIIVVWNFIIYDKLIWKK